MHEPDSDTTPVFKLIVDNNIMSPRLTLHPRGAVFIDISDFDATILDTQAEFLNIVGKISKKNSKMLKIKLTVKRSKNVLDAIALRAG